MQSKILLLLLFVGVFYSVYGQSDSGSSSSGSDSSSSDSSGSDSSGSDSSGSGSDSGSSADENDDDNDNQDEFDFYYPCGTTVDLRCVGDFFINTRQCRAVNQLEEGHTIIRRRQPVHLPKMNLTVITHMGEIQYRGARCEKFYMNKRTKNIVLTLVFESISIYAEKSEFIMHRRGKEAMKMIDYVKVNYSVALTAVIPVSKRVDMRSSSVSAYILDAHPNFDLGPLFSDSSVELVANTHRELMNNVPTAVQEIFLTDAYSYFFGYFENYISGCGIPYSY